VTARARRRRTGRLAAVGGLLAGLVLVGGLGGVGAGGRSALASTVVLVRPPRPSAVAAEATVRVRGELVAAGFDVQVIDAPPGEDIRTALEQAASGPEVEAVVAILGEERKAGSKTDSAELWVIDRVTGKTVVRRVDTEPGSLRSAEMLSIRALELLRASFLEVALGGAAVRTQKAVPAPPPPVEVTRWTREALQEADSNELNWAVEAGAYVLGSIDGNQGLPPSVIPLLRIDRRLGGAFMARLTVAGLGTRPHVADQMNTGSADIAQRLGLLEAVLRFRPGKQIQPFLSLGGGALQVVASGQPDNPNLYLPAQPEPTRYCVVGNAGVGLRFPLQRRFELIVELQVEVARPYPVIQINQVSVATEGKPTLLGSLTMAAWM